MNLEQLCLKTCELARDTGKFVQQQREHLHAGLIEEKGVHDLVTAVDKASEKRLAEGLTRLLPGSGIEAEEGTSERKGETWRWVVDPIDGTTNFIHGLPCYAISIALVRENTTVMGVVYEINQDECFYAWENGGAFNNGKSIRVSETTRLEDSLLATGFPYTDFGRQVPYMELFAYLMQHSRGLRRLGSAATDLAYVACGRFELFYEYGLKPWDVMAGAFLVQQAGGRVSDFAGGDQFWTGIDIVAANKGVFEASLEAVQRFFPSDSVG
ncbi:MAG: inositol monophosphatase family protein [Salibacteraceae bacterium]